MLRRAFVLAASAFLLGAPSAAANPPSLTGVSSQNLHLTAEFSSPRADYARMAIATKPDRATDGSFLSENIAASDSLTDSEIQTGRWLDEDQIDPGTYWVMLYASPSFSCYLDFGTYDPGCANGYSNVVQVTVPMPPIKYVASASFDGYEVETNLTASPLGVKMPYQVCYRLASRKRRCATGSLYGYEWNTAAHDELSISKRGLAKTTTFAWFVLGVNVANAKSRTR